MGNFDDKKIAADRIAKLVGSLYEYATKEIEKIIQESVASKRLGDANYYKQQKTKILKIVSDLQTGSAPIVAESVRSGYIEGGRRTSNWIKAFVGSNDTNFSQADKKAVETLAALTISRLENANSTMVKRAEDVLRAAALEDIAAINVSGPRFEVAADELQQAFDRAGMTVAGAADEATGITPRLIEINGRNYNAAKYAELVVRTESRNAHSLSTLQRMQENNLDKIQITSHSSTCEICAEYDGNVYSATGQTQGLDTLSEYPPFHPNCQHLITPTL